MQKTNAAGRAWPVEFPLSGPAGEPVDLTRTFRSHGLTSLPPMRLYGRNHEEVTRPARVDALEVTLPLPGHRPRTARISQGAPGRGVVEVVGPEPGREEGEALLAAVGRVLRLDEDLSPFYALASADPDLGWVIKGAGRMVRGATVFEDILKTLCTTNCSWSATIRMISALVEHLGEEAPGAPESGPLGRAFLTPEAMAGAGEAFYKEVARCGYRGRYMVTLSSSVVAGNLDLESLTTKELPDDEVEKELLALPGVGPYAAAHVMMLLGRYSRLILDSWTRPTYARLVGREAVADEEIRERFSPYGPYAGLAFWLYLTRGWIEELETATD